MGLLDDPHGDMVSLNFQMNIIESVERERRHLCLFLQFLSFNP